MENKKVKVVMLPTKDNSSFGLIHENNVLHSYTNGEDPDNLEDTLAKAQHLYFTSDDEIKDGDYVMDNIFGLGRIIIVALEECYSSVINHPKDGSITTPWKRNRP